MIVGCQRALLATLVGLILLLPTACGKGNSQPEKITKLNSELTEMVRYYQEMKQFGLAGNVDSFWARRDSVSKAFILDMFGRRGTVLDSGVVAAWAYTWPDIAGHPLVQDTTDGQWRRLVFIIDSLVDKDGRQKALYPVVMFRKENGQWKVANASRLAAYKLDKQGKKIPFKSLTYHELFRIPPTFPNLDSVAADGANPRRGTPIDPSQFKQPRKK
ncbi:MAG: hypothetical protein PHR28_03025 [candidate division Zixibacteria bacterium]|nr:hypothetical protein [candidate division Zixibacteria bacterium]